MESCMTPILCKMLSLGPLRIFCGKASLSRMFCQKARLNEFKMTSLMLQLNTWMTLTWMSWEFPMARRKEHNKISFSEHPGTWRAWMKRNLRMIRLKSKMKMQLVRSRKLWPRKESTRTNSKQIYKRLALLGVNLWMLKRKRELKRLRQTSA